MSKGGKLSQKKKGIATQKAACQSQILGPKYASTTKIPFCNTDQTIQIQPLQFLADIHLFL